MKKVILKTIVLKNFKGHKALEVDFNEEVTNIFGKNGVGKTSIFDAFTWLLFGKDKLDNQKFSVMHLVNGVVPKKVDTSVDAILEVDGEIVRLARVLSEDWVKPRGQAEEVLKGYVTKTFVNEVPMGRLKDYQDKVNSIVDESLFKLITNPEYFVSMDWKKQREVLFNIAGTVTNAEIANKNDDYKDLLSRISGKDLQEYKTEVTAKKNKQKEALKDIQPRIDQTTKLMPKQENWAEIEGKINAQMEFVSAIDKSKNDKSEALRLQYDKKQSIQEAINKLKAKKQEALFTAAQAEKERVHKESAERRSLNAEIAEKNGELSSYNSRKRTLEVEANGLAFRKEQKNKEIVALRQSWMDKNAEVYEDNTEDLICPIYNIVCKDAQATEKKAEAKEKAKAEFNRKKDEKLASIHKNGVALAEEMKMIDAEVEAKKADIKTTEENISSINVIVNGLIAKVGSMKAVEEKVIVEADVKECVEISSEIDKLEAEAKAIDTQAPDNSELDAKRAEIITVVDQLKNTLNNKEIIISYQKEIDSLNEQASIIAQSIADYERDEDLIKGFTRDKIVECENRINKMFNLVTFKLFDYTLDGNEFEVCVPLVAGVPYSDANTASKVNAGIDVINTLTRFYNTSAPIFIDGRESVTEIIDTDSQIVNLIVHPESEFITVK